MKINWGLKIMFLYACFVTLIMTLVLKSMHQKVELVSKEYYKDEIAYQDVINASKNQAALSAPVTITANEQQVIFEFPPEFKERSLSGNIQFYSSTNGDQDRNFDIRGTSGRTSIEKKQLSHANYKVKISWQADGKKYYQETELNLR